VCFCFVNTTETQMRRKTLSTPRGE
jgi:hypothetical protein